MKKHSEEGYRMAKNIPQLALIARGILHHHERWDGTGYPKGLKGKKIPIQFDPELVEKFLKIVEK